MNAFDWVKRHPLAFGLTLALVICSLTDIGMAFHLRSAGVERDQHRDRVRAMGGLADEFRALKTQSEAVGLTLPSNVRLTPDAVTAIAKSRGIAGHISTTSASTDRHDDFIQEQVVSLALTGVTSEDLALFLRAVEQIDPAVRTKELRLTANTAGAKTGPTALIDAHMQISAYETTARLSK